jgi:hypothetical protein
MLNFTRIEEQGSEFATRFAFGQAVRIDGDHTLVGRVTGFHWSAADDHKVEVQWLYNGLSYTSWFHESRLSAVPPDGAPAGAAMAPGAHPNSAVRQPEPAI